MSNQETDANSPDLVLLTEFQAAPLGNRPRRLFEAAGFPKNWECESLFLTANPDDDKTLRTSGVVRLSRWGSLRRRMRQVMGVWRLLPKIRKARFVLCLERAYFWYLVMFQRLGLFRFQGKEIVAYVDHVDPFFRRVKHLEKVPSAFKAFFLNQEQFDDALGRFSQADRARLFPWRIDTEWYHPHATRETHGWLVVPGNQDRHEGVVNALVESGRWKIWRIGRSPQLEHEYARWKDNPDFRLSISLTHKEYREAIQGAALVLLPIQPCDNPAGTTAALEAMACRVPLLCNKSPGIDELVQDGYGTSPVPDLEAKTWSHAIANLMEKKGSAPQEAALDQALAMVRARYSIKPDGGDWLDLWKELQTPRTIQQH